MNTFKQLHRYEAKKLHVYYVIKIFIVVVGKQQQYNIYWAFVHYKPATAEQLNCGS